MPYRIRAATRADFPDLVDFWIETRKRAVLGIDFEALRGFIATELAKAMEDGREVIVVAEADGAPCGFFILNTGTGEIEQTAVAPLHLGRGAAKALIEAAKDVCPRELFVLVTTGNPRAIWFYAREGFEVVGEGIDPHSLLPVLRMRWRPDNHS